VHVYAGVCMRVYDGVWVVVVGDDSGGGEEGRLCGISPR
jgi:hypothetical protein